MDDFKYKNETAYCEDVSLEAIAKKVGTPAYVYSSRTLKAHCDRMLTAFKSHPTKICYAVKANSNLTLLRQVFSMGLGADVVSIGELERAVRSEVDLSKVVFSGVGKTDDEIARAIQIGIFTFNVESESELARISRIAQGKPVPISLRINPNIDAKTNPYIATGLYSTKFGLVEEEMRSLLSGIKENPSLKLIGLSCHIGSQITDLGPFGEATDRMVRLATEVRAAGFGITTIDMGGGLGIKYNQEEPPSIEAYAETLLQRIRPSKFDLVIEPGRVLVGNVGVLLSTVVSRKQTPKKKFVIVDAAMNDLMRPTLYKSFHEVCAVKNPNRPTSTVDVVGPVCETGDFLALDRKCVDLEEGELIFFRGAGAYGSTMASNYNTRTRAPEIWVEGEQFRIVRRRETLEDLLSLES